MHAHLPPTVMMQFLEVVRIEGHVFPPEDLPLAGDMYLLQVNVICLHICLSI